MITLYNIEVDCNVYLTICFIILLCLIPDDLNSDLGDNAATQLVNQTIIRLSLSRDRPYMPMIV